MRRGLRLRLGATHVLVAALAIVAVVIVVDVTGQRRFDQYLADVRQRSDAHVVQALSRTYRAGVGWDAQAIYALSQTARLGEVDLAVYSPGGQLEFTVRGIEGHGEEAGTGDEDSGTGGETPLSPAASATPDTGSLSARSFDIRSYPVTVAGEEVATVEVYSLHEARIAAETSYEDALQRDLVLAALIAAALALLVGVLVSRRITKPLEELTDAARDAVAGDLEVHVAPRGEDEVASLATVFNTMSDALARDAQWRRDMTADLSDELRTPLATIQSHIAALEDGGLPPTAENLRAIGDEVERLGGLLGALRSLNELESEDFEVELAPIDLGEVAADALTSVEPEAARRQVTLEQDLASSTVRGDRDRLVQAVVNLFDNALKFTPAGGSVAVSLRVAAPSVILSVSDTGPGIDAVDLPFVFDRFYRSQTARGTQGLGLGLAIVKGLVEAHGGTVDAAGRAGGGAVFTVRLPLAG